MSPMPVKGQVPVNYMQALDMEIDRKKQRYLLLKAIELECTLPCRMRDMTTAVDPTPTERDRLTAIHSYIKQILYPS